ncbi:HAMP domain-containing sensor histidine kinase [Parvibaculaceae bacterium PLY_AMNH_Bact1]|nr:HAMP domain-containing sensor histidine kinase [Parvibaculaceae bacterium PLY_AMNH_Bact1]
MSLSAEPSKISNSADDGASAEPAAVQSPAVDPRIEAEQVRRLFDLGKSGSILIFIALMAVWLPFFGTSSVAEFMIPFGLLVASQSAFNLLRSRYHSDETHEISPKTWGDRYTRICLLSGGAWGVAGVLWLPDAPFASQAIFGVVVAGLCLNTVISRHVYPSAMLGYTTAAALPGMVTLLIGAGWEGQFMAALSSLMWIALYSATKTLHLTSVSAIALQLKNEELVSGLADAKAEAEKKAKDAETAYAVARKAARSRQDFLSMVTHEIRSPLASLSGLAHMLEATELDEKQRSYSRGVEESSRLLNRLVDDLSDLTEMEALSIKLRPTDLSPMEIAQAAIHVTRHDASSRKLSIEVDELPGTPKTIHNDPDRVKQALVNLIVRALRTTEVGGVMVRLSPVDIDEEVGVRFSVTDTGAGMPSEEAARLFSSLDNEGEHAPLKRRDVNLTICDRLVRLMGGRAGADSMIGGGFTAWFVLGPDISQRPKQRPGQTVNQDQTAPNTGQVLDFDRIYELEQDLGTARIADHLGEAIHAIADLQKALSDAVRRSDHRTLRAIAESLAIEANAIGLTGLSGGASHLLDDLPDATRDQVLSDRVGQLEAKFKSGANALTRAYPALAG